MKLLEQTALSFWEVGYGALHVGLGHEDRLGCGRHITEKLRRIEGLELRDWSASYVCKLCERKLRLYLAWLVGYVAGQEVAHAQSGQRITQLEADLARLEVMFTRQSLDDGGMVYPPKLEERRWDSMLREGERI